MREIGKVGEREREERCRGAEKRVRKYLYGWYFCWRQNEQKISCGKKFGPARRSK